MKRGSTWNIWDLHLHSPYSVLNNQFGNPESDETWDKYIKKIEEVSSATQIVGIGITDYFSIEGYKKVIEYQSMGRCKEILFLPNIEFRVDTIIYRDREEVGGEGRRLNLHVLFSPDVQIREIEENFLHNLDFVDKQDPYDLTRTMKLKRGNLETYGARLKSEQEEFSQYSDLYVGCMNVVVKTDDIKNILQNRFSGKFLLILAQQDISLLDWAAQHHGLRKQLVQLSHGLFSSNQGDREFCLGLRHPDKEAYLREFLYYKPCIWGCDAHGFDERFLAPTTEAGDIRYCWIKCDPTWEGLMQILYEPEDRVRIQEASPETTKSIYTLSTFNIHETTVNERLTISQTDLDLNPNLIAIIGGRGSGKTALLDLISSSFREGEKLTQLENSFFYRLYNTDPGRPIQTALKFASGDTFEKPVGSDLSVFPRTNITYLTQNHFEEYSANPQKLLSHIIDLIFERYSDKRREYDAIQSNMVSSTSEIQSINLNIQQLLEKTSERPNLEGQLKVKEGENADIEEKIKATEASLDVKNAKLDQTSTEVSELRRQILVLDGLQAKLDSFEGEINTFRERFATQAKELSDNLVAVFGPEHRDIFGPDLFNYDEIMSRISSNRESIKSKSAECSGKIQELEQIIATFEGGSKVIAELHQSRTMILEEIDSMNNSLEEMRKYEIEISRLENKRQSLFASIIQAYLDARTYLNQMIGLFEEGKNTILNNLQFKPVIKINLETFISFLDDKLNGKLISEAGIRALVSPVITQLAHLIHPELIRPETNKEIDVWISNQLVPVGLSLGPKKKKSTHYSEFYNIIFGNILTIGMEIKFNGTELDKLSMGQRAIVLLKILLALDDKPLLIDQPEEHLDNRFIYSELTPAIREAKKNRQIIIATHNANLVVNTDSEQIIIAEDAGGRISYSVTTLEDKTRRELLTTILEGGEEAFIRREDRYGRRF